MGVIPQDLLQTLLGRHPGSAVCCVAVVGTMTPGSYVRRFALIALLPLVPTNSASV